MIGKKWMLALSCAALLAAPAAGFAFGHTTVVADPRLGGSVPYIDGLRENGHPGRKYGWRPLYEPDSLC